jgi:hypothetical protein
MSAAKPSRDWPLLTAQALLEQPPHPYELLAERARGICLLSRLWAQSNNAPFGVRHSGR